MGWKAVGMTPGSAHIMRPVLTSCQLTPYALRQKPRPVPLLLLNQLEAHDAEQDHDDHTRQQHQPRENPLEMLEAFPELLSPFPRA
jgi:methyl coenzyme M reductase subunit C